MTQRTAPSRNADLYLNRARAFEYDDWQHREWLARVADHVAKRTGTPS